MARLPLRCAMIALVALAAAGCDKCGNRVRFDAPSVQHACGGSAEGR